MNSHLFLFRQGEWEGEGNISFSVSQDHLPFTMRWKVGLPEGGKISCTQEVTLQGFHEAQTNHFTLENITEGEFAIQLTNEEIENCPGKGLINEKRIAWEFHESEGIEGFEVYELQEDGSYKMRAEFLGGETYRTQVHGVIRPVTSPA